MTNERAADLRHLYLPAPACLLSQTAKGLTQAQVWLRKSGQFGAYTD